MSLLDDQIREANASRKQESNNSAKEHMAWLEKQRIYADNAMQNSVKANWDRLNAKRKSPKVLQKLPLLQLQ